MLARMRSARPTLAICSWLAAALLPGAAHAAWQRFQASAGGLADNQIYSISEDPRGGLWFGTGQHEADHFDGVSWTAVNDSLPSGSVDAVLEDHGGRQWFGMSTGGLAMFDGRRWSRYSATAGNFLSDHVGAILEDHRGDLWFGTSNGLARYEPTTNRWSTFTATPGALVSNSITRLFEDDARQLWIATIQGVNELDSTRTFWTRYVETPGALEQDSVIAVCQDRHGAMWFGTTQGVYVLDDGSWRHLSGINGLPNDIVLSLARDSTGRMWMGGADGVVHTDGASNRSDRLTSDSQVIGPVQSLIVDSSGNLWLGGGTYNFLATQAQGLFRYDGVSWRNFFSPSIVDCPPRPSPGIPYQNVLASNCVVTGLVDHAGDRWFPTTYAGIAELDHHEHWSIWRRAGSPLLSDTLSAIAEDGAHALWFGSPSAGVSSVDSTRTQWSAFGQADGLASNSVTTLFVDHAGDLWAGCAGGVSRRNGSLWSNFLTGGFPITVQAMAEDAAHQLWIQTDGGLYSIDAARTSSRAWSTADGLADDIVTALLSTSDGSMWFGTARGLSRLTSGSFTTWKNFGVPGDSSVSALGSDAAGNVVVGTNRDVSVFGGGGWNPIGTTQIDHPTTMFATDSGGILWAFSNARADYFDGRGWRFVDGQGGGLAANATNSTFEDAVLSRWFPSYNGLAEYQPDRVAPQTVFVNRPPSLSASRSASFVYGAAYGEVADVDYSYSWDGASGSPFSSQTTFNISGVPDGIHTFQVRARDWFNNVDPTPAAFTFEVDATPPPAQISFPVFSQPVRGQISITGTAADPRFHDYTVMVRAAGGPAWGAPGTITLTSSLAPVSAGTLAQWNTTTLPDGDYELRLAVTDTIGLVGIATLTVVVDNVAPFANVTSPVRLVARDGGDVYTTHAEAHLYFPPNAFDADPLVTVDSTAAAPDTIPGAGIRAGPAWTIGWTGAQMRKSGVLELRPWVPGGAQVWRDDGAAGWTHLGGTAQSNGAVALDLASPGRYALIQGGAASSQGGNVSNLTLTPRAFSPNGHFASTDVSIGFTLARPGDYSVKLYNRAGRMVRSVARNAAGTAGANLVRWDGKNDDGGVVDPGLYIVTVEALGETRTRTVGVVR